MKKLGKIVAVTAACAALVGSVAAFSACGDGSDKLTITGSSSVTPLMKELAAAYEKEHDVTIEVQQSDSGTGIKDAQNGLNDFGMASRDVKSEETGVTAIKIAIDGVALITNKANTAVTNVTSQELYDLYANGTTIQSSISAGITREDGSGTRDAFDDLVKNAEGKKLKDLKKLASIITTQDSTGKVMSAIQADSDGTTIGYISMGSVAEALTKDCKTVNFEGVEPTAANVSNKSYALQRNFNIVYNTEAGLSELAQDFVDFILSEEGKAIIEEEGYINV